MHADRANVVETAIAWHIRLAEADDAVWAAFIDWIAAHPDHADAYDRVAMADRAIATASFPAAMPVAGNDNPAVAAVPAAMPGRRGGRPAGRRWALAGGLGAAAAVAASVALVLPSALPRGAEPYSVTTRAGERRTVALADGTRIEMSGGTRLTLDRRDQRIAALENGEAVFHVRHDAERPFTITSGGVTLRDLGTVFNVARDGDRIAVAVAEGAVLFQPQGAAVTLRPGDALAARTGGQDVVRSRVAPAMVGGWRNDQFSFDGQPVREVARTLHRQYGIAVKVEGRLSARPFTGMVRFSGAADRDVPHLAELIGATWRRDGRRWILSDGEPDRQ